MAVAFPPQAVGLALPDPNNPLSPHTSSPRNRWTSKISDLEKLHGRVRVSLAGPPEIVAEVTLEAVGDLQLVPGMPVTVSVKATEIEVYPA